MLPCAVALRTCLVSFKDHRGITHTTEVQAESLYEAAILGVRVFRAEPWVETVGPTTVLDVEVREPGTRHAITLQQVERWLAGTAPTPSDASKKARLKVLLMKG
jgi:hypothetical protein